jgi:hypothetical protein
MTNPLRERTLLQSARDVLSKADTVQPEFNVWRERTGVTHPLAAALADLQSAVDMYKEAG